MNLVCADVRLIDGEKRREFLSRLEYDIDLQRIFAKLFRELEYTYDIGSLLKVRAPFERLLRERKKGVQTRLLPKIAGQTFISRKGVIEGQSKLSIEEERKGVFVKPAVTLKEMLEVLLKFEREGMEKKDMGTMLFAAEAEKSVGLLHLLSQKYDVIVMNPPYGDMPKSTKEYVKKYYPRTHFDYYAAFIEQAVDLCEENGFVGMLTGRTFMFLQRSEKIRTEILLEYARPEVLFDLNLTPADNILDEATARWAATIIRKIRDKSEKTTCVFIRLTLFQGEQEKIKGLENALRVWLEKGKHEIFYPVKLQSLKKLPRMPYSYWVPYSLIELFKRHPPLDKDHTNNPDQLKVADLVVGLKTGDNNRFCRYFWEVANETLGKGKKWVPFAKGVDRFYSNIDVVVNWERNGQEIKDFPKSSVANEDYYFHQGLHWPNIASSVSLNFSVLPKNTIFSNATRGLFPSNKKHTMALLAIGNSKLSSFLYVTLDPLMHNRDLGYVTFIPISKEALENKEIKALAEEAYCIIKEWNTGNEVSIEFIKPWLLQTLHGFNSSEKPITQHPLAQQFEWSDWPILEKIRSICGSPNMSVRELAELCIQRESLLKKRLYEIQELIDKEIYDAYNVREEDINVIEEELKILWGFPKALKKDYRGTIKSEITVKEHVCRLVSYYIKISIEEDSDGIVSIDELLNNIRNKISDDFGKDQLQRVESEISEILGKDLKDWILEDFFDFHVGLYKRRPIIWHMTSANFSSKRGSHGAFNCFLYYHKLSKDTIPKIRTKREYLKGVLDGAKWKAQRLKRELQRVRESEDKRRERQLQREYEESLEELNELLAFDKKLEEVSNPRDKPTQLDANASWVERKIAEVRDNGWNPILDYGVRVNIEPLKEASLLHKAAERVK